jgi:hypothetical protein
MMLLGVRLKFAGCSKELLDEELALPHPDNTTAPLNKENKRKNCDRFRPNESTSLRGISMRPRNEKF